MRDNVFHFLARVFIIRKAYDGTKAVCRRSRFEDVEAHQQIRIDPARA